MTTQRTFILNKWAEPPNEVEPIPTKTKQGYQTRFVWTREIAGKIMDQKPGPLVRTLSMKV
jgi:hypothetical protein